MNEKQFEILDASYFLTNADEVVEETGLSKEDVVLELAILWSMGYLRVYNSPSGQEFELGEPSVSWDKVWFTASKKGLMEHNSTS